MELKAKKKDSKPLIINGYEAMLDLTV